MRINKPMNCKTQKNEDYIVDVVYIFVIYKLILNKWKTVQIIFIERIRYCTDDDGFANAAPITYDILTEVSFMWSSNK